MNERSRERGEGKIGLLIALAILGAAVFAGAKYIPIRVRVYEFTDFVRQECRFAAVRNQDAEVVKRILEKAKALEIPLDKKNLRVERTGGEMVISYAYQIPVDFKVSTYNYRVREKERAPLF